jgi:hypothetical protein
VDRKTKILANGAGAKHGITENDVMELSRCPTLSSLSSAISPRPSPHTLFFFFGPRNGETAWSRAEISYLLVFWQRRVTQSRERIAPARVSQRNLKRISNQPANVVRRKVEESQQRCDLLGERVREEMRRMKRSKGSEIRAMLCGFVSVQLKYGSEVQSSWERVLPSLVSGMDPNALNKP